MQLENLTCPEFRYLPYDLELQMQQLNSRVSAYRMAKSQELQENSKARKTEQKLRHEALAKISAAPRHEAENSIQQSVQDMVAPFSSRLDELEDRLPKT